MIKWSARYSLETGQRFPAGATVKLGTCAGLCRRTGVDVVSARVGPTYRQAKDMPLCAECLGDFVTGAPVMGVHVYALTDDFLYHEIRGSG
jgi:hypothetical protein